MNLYLRYFDKEILVNSADEAIAFLSEIDEIGMNHMLEADIRDYVASDVAYPKRYKIRSYKTSVTILELTRTWHQGYTLEV